MAYLLYKYIKKRIANPEEVQEVHEQELKLSNDHQSPFEVEVDSSSNPNVVSNDITTESNVKTISAGEKRASRIYRWKLVAGLFLPFSLQALETTIVAGALPFIASDFSKLSI